MLLLIVRDGLLKLGGDQRVDSPFLEHVLVFVNCRGGMVLVHIEHEGMEMDSHLL